MNIEKVLLIIWLNSNPLFLFPSLSDDTLRQNFSQFGQIYDIRIFPEKFYGFIK